MRFSLACQSASGMPPRRNTSSRFSDDRPRITTRTSSSAPPILASAAMLVELASGCGVHAIRCNDMVAGVIVRKTVKSQGMTRV